MGYIFISYSHKDSEYVRKLENALIQKGIEVWIDERIDYGTRWPKVIQDQLDACDAFIVVVSTNSYESEWVQHEVTRAQRKRKPFFPLLLDGDTWLSIESTQYVDVREGKLPPANFYDRLGDVVFRRQRPSDLNQELPNSTELPFASHGPVARQFIQLSERTVSRKKSFWETVLKLSARNTEVERKGRLFEVVNHPLFIGIFFSLFSALIRFYIFPLYSFLIDTDTQLIQSFIEWFGVAYGLFTSLVLVNVWIQYDSLERDFDREADAILMFYQLAKQIKETSETKAFKSKVVDYIKAYVWHVINNFEQEHKNPKIRESGDQILESVRNILGELIYTNARDAITSELIRELNEVIDLRGDRISQSKQRIPRQVWTISLLSSVLWVVPFYVLNFRNDWVAIFLVGGVTVIVTAILAIIKDLDNPFEGTWKISTNTWEILGEKLE